ncbi:MAG TPA: amidohydrolase [Leeuwenhoekiella sp.]|nr:amidohydrolase [Leeuwenhoekiella sp.]
MLRKLLTFFIAFTTLLSCEKKPEPVDIVVKNISIINLKTGKIRQNQSVFIAADTIYKIQKNADNNITAVKTIDGTGQFLLPGFWDNHVHFRGGDSLIAENKHLLNLYIANGVTTVRDAGGDLTTSVQSWQKDIASGTLMGPTIYTSGPKIDGPDARWAGSLEVSNSEEINRALDSLQALNVDFVKLYDSTISGENYLKTIKNAEKRGMITSGHMPYTVKVDETIEAGIDGIEHLYYVLKGCSTQEQQITEEVKNGSLNFWSSLAQVMKTYSDSTAQNQFDKLIASNVYIIPTLHIGHTLSYLDENNHSKDKYLKYMGKGIQKTYAGRIKSALSASPEFVAMRKKLDSTFVALAGKLNDAKVGLLAGSDSGSYNSYIYPGISLHKELKALVDAGLTPLEALQTSSQNGAKFLKKQLPEIKIGAQADLVILQKNPLQQIENTTAINWVLKNGKALDKKQLKNLLKSE